MHVRIRIRRSFQPQTLSDSRQAETTSNPLGDPASVHGARRSVPALGASSLVALGILISRITGLVRERVIAHYFGQGPIADAFRAAIRIPYLLYNLFGEGVLSASFITVYSKLRAQGEAEEAEYLAEAIFGLLAVASSVLVLAGVLATPWLVDIIAWGFSGERRALTVRLVRILFPGTGLLVMSAWCLGVLNSHRQFLLSYLAPVASNIAMIGVLLSFGGAESEEKLITDLAWGFVLGSALQFLVQLPRVLQLLPHFRPALELHSQHVRTVVTNFGPIFLSRGVVQISSTVDSIIASTLPAGAVAALANGQIIALLPVSLFSMSISAAELPALSSAVGTDAEVAALLQRRLLAGLRRIAFFIVPSAVAFLALGDTLVAALYQSGRFSHGDARYTWSVLAGSAIGLLATAMGRLYASAFYALLDTKTPLRFAIVRIALTISLGALFALAVPRWLGIGLRWGVAGLTASAGLAGWVEFALLRRALQTRIGAVSLPPAYTAKLWSAAIAAAAVSYPCKFVFSRTHPLLAAELVLPVYGVVYFGVCHVLKVAEAKSAFAPLLRFMPGRR